MLGDWPLAKPAPESPDDWWQKDLPTNLVSLDSDLWLTDVGLISWPTGSDAPVETSCPGSPVDFDVENLTGEKALSEIEAELFEHTYLTTEDPFSCPPLTAEGQLRIENLIDSCGLYDRAGGRWVSLAKNPTSDSFLQEAFRHLFDAVLTGLNESRDRSIVCLSREKRSFNVFPALALCTTNPLFPPRAGKDADLYRNCLTPIEVRLEEQCWLGCDILQLAIYAKQCLTQQHNRDTVPCLLLSESRVQAFVFDRNGVTFTPTMDMHRNPIAFVRMMLQVSQPLGFDQSIVWRDGARYLSFSNLSARIVEDSPAYITPKLVGAGTTCWRTINQQGHICFVKSFFAHDRNGKVDLEWKVYRDSQGLPGIGRMLGHLEGTVVSGVKQQKPVNRPYSTYPRLNTKCYLFLEYYERSILQFNGRMELLCAFRDAIAGHANLWKAGIWHRDIRPKNIRIGHPGSAVGDRGVLVGFESVKRTRPDPSLFSCSNYLRGDNTYKSISLLTSTVARIHTDYLDDLESFFYILCHICSVYEGPHSPVDQSPPCFADWDSDDPMRSARAKNVFLSTIQPGHDIVKPYFGDAFSKLLLNLRGFLVSYLWIRFNVVNQVPPLRQYTPDVDYAHFLQFFDDAICDLDLFGSHALSVAPSISSPEVGTPDTMFGFEDFKEEMTELTDLDDTSTTVHSEPPFDCESE